MAFKDSFYYDDYHNDDYFNEYEDLDTFGSINEPSFNDVIFGCGFAVLKQISIQLLSLLAINIVYRLIRQTSFVPEFIKHLSSSLLGYGSTFIFFTSGNYYVCLLVFISYAYLKLLQLIGLKRQGFATIVFQIVLIFTCELIEYDTTIWHPMRGTALICSMKTISIAFDLSSTKLPKLPPVYEYAGYMFCPSNVVLGPFVSFSSYKQMKRVSKTSFRLLLQIVLNSFLAVMFLLLSSCFLSYLISDRVTFLSMYRDALTFRSSHYFVSFMSAVMILASDIESKTSCDIFGYQVTKPLDIELPRSLITVVISWNIPIHLWLKAYVFHNVKRYGNFKAIIVTYMISASLHGLNFQLAAVLLSIGLFSFVEYRLRNVLAEILDACVMVTKCRTDLNGNCASKNHKNTTSCYWVKLINLSFSIFAIILLAYLGILMETSMDLTSKGFSLHKHLQKWIDLNFFGHAIVLVFFLIYLILRN